MMEINNKALFVTCLKAFKVAIIWQILELIFYSEIQSRIVDDIIWFFIFYYIYQAEKWKRKPF